MDARRADPDDWQDTGDIEVIPGQWAPRYYRCSNARCLRLVTYGQIRLGGCVCGGGRVLAAGPLDVEEVDGLKRGDYPLTDSEYALIQPEKDCRVTEIVE